MYVYSSCITRLQISYYQYSRSRVRAFAPPISLVECCACNILSLSPVRVGVIAGTFKEATGCFFRAVISVARARQEKTNSRNCKATRLLLLLLLLRRSHRASLVRNLRGNSLVRDAGFNINNITSTLAGKSCKSHTIENPRHIAVLYVYVSTESARSLAFTL